MRLGPNCFSLNLMQNNKEKNMTVLDVQSKRKLGNALHWWDFIPAGIGILVTSAHVTGAPENWLNILVGSYLGSFFGIVIYRGILSETNLDLNTLESDP